MIAATDITAPACRALRRIESAAPADVTAIHTELAKVRRRIARGDYSRAGAAAEAAQRLAERLEHCAELPHWRAVRRLALELRELAAVLRQEAAAGGAA
jgi:hypothetical protein